MPKLEEEEEEEEEGVEVVHAPRRRPVGWLA
jgi:hypothetical protein